MAAGSAKHSRGGDQLSDFGAAFRTDRGRVADLVHGGKGMSAGFALIVVSRHLSVPLRLRVVQ